MKNPKISAAPGDILYSSKNKNRYGIDTHYIIYLGPGSSDDLFDDAMLTHSGKKKFKNIPLSQEHIKVHDKDGSKFEFQYDDSYISPDRYHKKMEWKPFRKSGELTEEGLEFVLDKISKETIFFRFNL